MADRLVGVHGDLAWRSHLRTEKARQGRQDLGRFEERKTPDFGNMLRGREKGARLGE